MRTMRSKPGPDASRFLESRRCTKAWPSWYSNSKNVNVLNTPDHRLRKNARISWETFGFHIDSRVWEFEPGSRLGWFGDGKDVHAYHPFLLTKTPEGCHIVTEEVVKGPGAIQFREQRVPERHARRASALADGLEGAVGEALTFATNEFKIRRSRPCTHIHHRIC